MQFKTYEKYKPSGIEWLGKIPEGWEARRFSFLFTFNKGLSITKENLQDRGIPCVNYGEIHSRYGFEVDPKRNALKCVSDGFLKTDKNSILKYGDFVFADTSEDIEGSGNFTYLNSDETVFAGYHTMITKPRKKINYRYTAYLLDSLCYRNQIRSKVTGIKVFSITKGILKDTIVLFPSLDEQQSIANRLDQKTFLIDKKIELLKKKKAKYKELKQNLINEIVTKGLNKNVEMKDSDIEWVGKMPKHWDVKRLKEISRDIYAGGTPSTNVEEYWNKKDCIWLPSGELQNNVICKHTENIFISNAGLKNSSTKKINKNTVLIALTGATCANIGYLTFDACANQSVIAIGNSRFFDSKYLFYSLLTKRNYIKVFQTGGAQAGINTEDVKNLWVSLPPKSEQISIATYLAEKTGKINTITNTIDKNIEALQEFRKTLINDVVTGKVKVS